MGREYPRATGESLAPLLEMLKAIQRRLSDLESPTGTSVASLVRQVQIALANIATTVTDAINSLSYTKTEIDSRIASPAAGSAVTGNISATGNLSVTGTSTLTGSTGVGGDLGVSGAVSAGDMTASGRVTSSSAFRSAGSRAYICVSGYAGGWIDGDGTFGISPSSIRFKIDIEEWLPDIERLLLLRAVLFRYDPAILVGAKADAAKQLGFIAEELEALGFPEFVFYDDGEWEWSPDPDDSEDGEYVLVGPPRIQGINYDRITVALLRLAQHEHTERLSYQAANDARVRAIEEHLGL